MNFQIVDGVLQVFVTYKFTTKVDVAAEDSMESVIDAVTHAV
jgi:hypothetical protein